MSFNRRVGQIFAVSVRSLPFVLLFTSLTFAQGNQLRDDEAAIASNIKALRNEVSDIRAAAARVLRRIVAKYPSGNTNIRSKDGGKAFWTKRVNLIGPGMPKSEVTDVLPPFSTTKDLSKIGTGQSHYLRYRLDYDWVIQMAYRNSDDTIQKPTLIAQELAIYVPPPERYTGTWICWYVNGQKGYEITFVDGKYDGVFTKFHDNGQKAVEQHYVANEGHGTDTGWDPEGRVSYTAQYYKGKQDGTWTHFYPDGRKRSERNYKSGVLNGLFAEWYENGQMRFEMNYKNGVKHGVEAAWNEHDVLQYRREYMNGKVIE